MPCTSSGSPTISRHLHARVQRAERVLVDHLHAAADRPHARAVVAGDVLALELDLARGDVDHLQDGEARRALAAARFAHQAQRLAAAHVERHAVDRLHAADLAAHDGARHHREVDFEVLDLEDGVRRALSWAWKWQAERWSGRALDQRRTLVAADGRRHRRQRGAKAQPGGRLARLGGEPSIGTRRAAGLLVEPRHRGHQADRVGMARPRVDLARRSRPRRCGRRT